MRALIAALLFAVSLAAGAQAPKVLPDQPAQPPKVLRVAFPTAETGFDPAKIADLYSRTVTPHIFESLYSYDHLARPFRIKPLTAAGEPEHSADFSEWTFKVRPGIFFQDDPAFGGKPRELVAADYVYSIKRFVDPANKSPAGSMVEDLGLVGLNAYRDEVVAKKQPFDYDHPIEGITAPDRYTLRIKLTEPRPRLVQVLADASLFGAVAREVVERYGEDTMAHPVGTGPFRLAQWRRSSFIALERNPTYRERLYDEEPAADDAEGQAIAAKLRGRRIPMVDRVEISIIVEEQPRWLTFINGGLDFIAVPSAFVPQVLPGNKLAPHLAKKGFKLVRTVQAAGYYVYFNLDDPVVGGTTPEQVALRRAVGLAFDVPRLIALVYRGQGVPAQQLFLPHCSGNDPHFKSEMGDYDPARARALLDLYGLKDRDGDGWRERPDGSPLAIEMGTSPSQLDRQIDELLQKNLAAIGVRIGFKSQQWSENLKAAFAGKLQMWFLGGSAGSPDGQDTMQVYYSQQIGGGQNFARIRNAELDRLYEDANRLPDGPERDAIFDRTRRITTALMPYKAMMNPVANDLSARRLVGHRRPLFWTEWYHLVDIEE